LLNAWKPSTRHISRLPGQAAVLTHPVVVVRVMDPVRFNVPRAPRECRMTLSAPHLIAPVNLEDGCCALWAVARIPGQELGRGDVTWVACMRHISLEPLDLVAIRAGPDLAQTALPGCAEKA
jgi:hypothetical protein